MLTQIQDDDKMPTTKWFQPSPLNRGITFVYSPKFLQKGRCYMDNNQNAVFAEKISPKKDVQIFWSHDFKTLKNIPKILAARTFAISQNCCCECVNPHEVAITEFMCGLRSYIAKALAEIIIEDFCEKFKEDYRLYDICLEDSKFFFDTWTLCDYLESAFEVSNSKEEIIKYLKRVFNSIYEHEKKHLIKYEKF